MIVLQVHNRYRERAGEDAVVDAEAALLEGAARVVRYQRDSRDHAGSWTSLMTGLRLKWSSRAYQEVSAVVEHQKPDVAHFHNIFPLITPAAYDACAERGVPVVQTLHNYRIWCAPGNFFRAGRNCEECVEHGPSRSVRYGCYRGSRLASYAFARMQRFHAARQTWTEKVDLYVALTGALREKVIALGLPPGKVVVKPHFVPRPPSMRVSVGESALFVGRLAPEKGARVVVQAFEKSPRGGLDIVGTGPEDAELRALAKGFTNVRFHGRVEASQVQEFMVRSAFLVFPSIWYEPFGRVLIEAMALGVPVVASRLGGIPEIVRDGVTGLLFEPGNLADLAEKTQCLFRDHDLNRQLGENARAEYERRYTPERNLEMMLDIYRRAVESKQPLSG